MRYQAKAWVTFVERRRKDSIFGDDGKVFACVREKEEVLCPFFASVLSCKAKSVHMEVRNTSNASRVW